MQNIIPASLAGFLSGIVFSIIALYTKRKIDASRISSKNQRKARFESYTQISNIVSNLIKVLESKTFNLSNFVITTKFLHEWNLKNSTLLGSNSTQALLKANSDLQKILEMKEPGSQDFIDKLLNTLRALETSVKTEPVYLIVMQQTT